MAIGEEPAGSGQAEGRSAGRVVAERYRLESLLGHGGMGVVWLAVDTLIGRRVALKELRAPAGVPQAEEASFVERAIREARNAGRLNHPSVVGVHDVIAPSGADDAVYIVMEYVPAPTLAEILHKEGPLPAPRAAATSLGILDALMAAHTIGIVHRDVKPGNVLVPDGDRVKLTDFGIALAAEDTRLTKSGVVGTQAYLAPECFDSGQASPAADLWALGATMFHMVAGRAPFDRETTTATLRAILFEAPPPPPCEPPLAEVITGLLTRPIDQRLTADVTRQLLEKVIASAPSSSASSAMPTVDPPAGRDPSSWDGQATSLHHPRPAPPPAQPWGPPTPPTPPIAPPGPLTTQPAAQPSPATTARSTQPSTPLPRHLHTGDGWGVQPGGPGRTKSSNPVLWVLIGVVSVVAVVVGVVMVTSGGGGGSSTSSPEGAVRGMMEALIDGDCQRVGDFVTPNMDDVCSDRPDDVSGSVRDVRTISEEGDHAVVRATHADGDGDDAELDYDVVRVDGEWRVDGVVLPDIDAALEESGAEAEGLAHELIDAINSGDEATAVETLCSSTTDESEIADAIAEGANLEIDPTAEPAMGFQADLTGTVGGEPATGYLTAQWNCVSSFFLRVDRNG